MADFTIIRSIKVIMLLSFVTVNHISILTVAVHYIMQPFVLELSCRKDGDDDISVVAAV